MSTWLAVLCWWLAFAGSHLVLSSLPVRRPLIARLGERGFQGLYSLVALATFVGLVRAYWAGKHTGPLLWDVAAVPGVRPLAVALAGAAVVLTVLAFVQPSPSGMVPGMPAEPRGTLRIVRHPLFTGLGLWGIAHLLVNGWASDVAFFGGFPVFWVIGGAHQDARKRALEGARLRPFFAQTSLIPFAAIAAGRTRLALGEIPLVGVVIGLGVAVALYTFHARLFGG